MALPLNPFAAAAARAVAGALDLEAAMFPVGAPPRPELGDFAVGCFPAARLRKKAPAALAAEVAAAFSPNEHLASARATGPFVNFRADRGALYRHLTAATGSGDAAPLIPTSVGEGRTVCIDYSSPNISKHLAYHHIRSTVIGHALVNLYRALGFRVVGINHLGDWGTTHGMLLAACERWGAPQPLTVAALNDLYVRFRREMASDPALEEQGRAWFKKIEDGDPEARRLWKLFRDVSWREFEEIYDRLGIHFDEVRGESEYEKDMPAVLEMLADKGLSRESEGALVVPLDDADMPPLLLRKRDGATLYGTRDLATAIYRWETYHFWRSLYVVDRGQSLHFRQLFTTLARAGFEWADRCEHIPFGLVRIGGKKTGTRTGNVVLLREVLTEAEQRSLERVGAANPEMSEADLAAAARRIGIGAVVFANLASQREKDVDFAWEDVLSWEGDSGPYIQYAHARCASILRRADAAGLTPAVDADRLVEEAEWALARKLSDVADIVARSADANEPHHLSRYLLDVCAVFSRWYTAGNQDPALRVLTPDTDVARARLALVVATQAVLRTGLALLGIEAPDKM